MKTKDGKLVIEQDLDGYFKTVMESNPFTANREASLLDVPQEIKNELVARGLEWRWIDSRQYETDGNQHKQYWVPYRRGMVKSSTDSETYEFKFGVSADGFVRRKGAVLAVRPKQLGDKHRAMIKEKTRRQAEVAQTEEARFRKEAQRMGVKTEVIED